MNNKTVKIKVAKITTYLKLVPSNYEGKCSIREFTIINKPNEYNSHYTVVVDNDIIGWSINTFHVMYLGIDKKYLGKKFYDVSKEYFIK